MIRTKIEKKVKEKRNDAINPIVLSSFLFATTFWTVKVPKEQIFLDSVFSAHIPEKFALWGLC